MSSLASPTPDTPKSKRSRVINSTNQQHSPATTKATTGNTRRKSGVDKTSPAKPAAAATTVTPPVRMSTRRAAAESSLAWESLRKRPRRSLSDKSPH